MRIAALVGTLFLLAACGADGEPTQPTMNGSIGVGSDGVFGRVGVSNGPVSISIGRGGCYHCW